MAGEGFVAAEGGRVRDYSGGVMFSVAVTCLQTDTSLGPLGL
jgi:hypothetical protein